jgi:hypothetical protein
MMDMAATMEMESAGEGVEYRQEQTHWVLERNPADASKQSKRSQRDPKRKKMLRLQSLLISTCVTAFQGV